MSYSKKNVTNNDIALLSVIKRLRFVTAHHVAYWQGLSNVRSSLGLLAALADKGLLKVYKERRPFVYRLSDAGAAYVNAEYQMRWHSAPAIHQYLMANSTEIFLRTRFPEFRMLSRQALKPYGINPAVAEHTAGLGSGQGFALVIIDDYNMRPSRVLKILTKVHNTANNTDYQARVRVTGKAIIPKWENAVKQVFIVTTNSQKLTVLSEYLQKNVPSVPYEIHHIEPVWRIA